MRRFVIVSTLLFLSEMSFALEHVQINPSVGFGVNALTMQLATNTNTLNYSATNQQFTFLNLSINGISASAKFPLPDPESSRQTRGDSKVMDYQIAVPVLKNWNLEAYYQNYKGYYAERDDFGMQLPSLQMSHTGGQVFYTFKPQYSYNSVQSPEFEQKLDSGSWILSAGVDQFTMSGDLTPKELGTGLHDSLQSVNATSLSLRIGYGYNWFWSQWYAGVAGGVGTSWNHIRYDYKDLDGETDNSKYIGHFGSLFGYRFSPANRLGVFLRAYTWSLAFDDKELTTNTTTMGIFYTHIF